MDNHGLLEVKVKVLLLHFDSGEKWNCAVEGQQCFEEGRGFQKWNGTEK
jgi:hypothetical protein